MAAQFGDSQNALTAIDRFDVKDNPRYATLENKRRRVRRRTHRNNEHDTGCNGEQTHRRSDFTQNCTGGAEASSAVK